MPWELTGNPGTNPAANFVGTIDNQPLAIRTNSVEMLRILQQPEEGVPLPEEPLSIIFHPASVPASQVVITSGGRVGIGTRPTTGKLHVRGNLVVETGNVFAGERGDLSVSGALTIYGDLNVSQRAQVSYLRVDEGTIARGVAIGTDPPGVNYPFEYETVGVSASWLNLRLQSPNAIFFHTGDTLDQRMAITEAGEVEVTTDIRLLNADCAEDFDVSEEAEEIEPGTVVVIDEEGAVKQSQQAYDKRVAGVISGAGEYRSAIILDKRGGRADRMPVALMGKVGCKVDAHYSSIEVGDLLTTSPTPGHAMKADDPLKALGSVIGKALRPLKGGQRIIPILAALQ
jgi:hypothetical protein